MSEIYLYIGNFIALLGGLGLFLYGMKLMGDGLELAAGNRLSKWLEVLTNNRFLGLLIGTAITAIIQSSSATTVMVVGFVNAGIMQLSQAVGVIMGANIGTTVTGLIVSLNISVIAPAVAFVGIIMMMFAKKKNVRSIGQILAGFGILFIGMTLMSDSMKPIAASEGFQFAITQAKNPLVGLMIGIIFTAIMQSSSAMTGVLIMLVGVGALDLNTAVFILYGTNIGTCITAILASLGAGKSAKKAAVIHLLFNVIGSILFIIITLLPIGFTGLIEGMVPNNPKLQLSMTHVIFNIVSTIVLFPFANYLVTIASKIIPGEDKKRAQQRLMFLDSRILSTPSIAVSQVRKEVERMAELALENYRTSIDIFLGRNSARIEDALANEQVINFLNHEITGYLVKISALDLEYMDNKMIGSLYHVVNDIERIGDHAENIVEFSQSYLDNSSMFSEGAIQDLKDMSENVDRVLVHAIDVFKSNKYEQSSMDQIKKEEDTVDSNMETFKGRHIARLEKSICNQASGMLFVNMLNDLERIADHATNIAYSLRYRNHKN